MNPFRFGPDGRQLFAIYHPATAAPRHEGVLLCNPFGQEAIRCHRLFRILADQLARQGFDVLRFDYLGTGDSDGDDTVGDLDAWCDDVLAASTELQRRSGAQRIAWLGLRLGATVAAMASARTQQPLSRLVLWDPVIDGNAFLAAMAAAHRAARTESFGARWAIERRIRDQADIEASTEVLGFALTARLRAQLAGLGDAQLARTDADQIALLIGPGVPEAEALRQQLARQNKSVSLTTVSTAINWTSNEAMDSSIVPPDALKAIVALLKGTS
ncbi:exosortase A-associated hydrolase 2 [Actimicrobium sp. GrIS 1.19]|uniref:alpha/beta fold hydrolase n=1 Tax=Actimicrobium sp. GrIS 1.19 TaxID=3071708 RepID=UPI002DFCCEF9|nr:exosortase A-associated hydrolase 2 [Actimicrobium sp. GrIS 1.19]